MNCSMIYRPRKLVNLFFQDMKKEIESRRRWPSTFWAQLVFRGLTCTLLFVCVPLVSFKVGQVIGHYLSALLNAHNWGYWHGPCQLSGRHTHSGLTVYFNEHAIGIAPIGTMSERPVWRAGPSMVQWRPRVISATGAFNRRWCAQHTADLSGRHLRQGVHDRASWIQLTLQGYRLLERHIWPEQVRLREATLRFNTSHL